LATLFPEREDPGNEIAILVPPWVVPSHSVEDISNLGALNAIIAFLLVKQVQSRNLKGTGQFRVYLCLCFKLSLRAKPFI